MKTDQPTPQPQRPTNNRKVFDVRRPGKAPASPTSRPIIVGHQAQAARTQISVSGIGERGLGEQLLDSHKKIELAVAPQPAVLATEPAEDKGEIKEKETAKKGEPAIEPVRDPDEPIDDAELAELAVEGPEAVEPLPPDPVADEAPVQPTQPSQPATPAATTATQATANPFTTEENEAANAHAAAMAMPAEEGAVIAEHGQTHILRTLLLILVLIAVVAFIFDILLDSGVVMLKAIPHTHFFGV